MAKDYYKTLGLDQNASADDIKSAFRRLAHQYHPDKSTGDAGKFKEINEAYQVLSDAEKRKQYDQYGQTFEQAQSQGGFGGFEGFRDWNTYAQAGGINVEDLGDLFGGFGDLFGMGRQRGGTRTARGRDLETTITITFLQMVKGTTVDMDLDRDVVCSSCKGSGAEHGTATSTCKGCNGTGQKQQARRTMFGTFQTVAACTDCNGLGKTIDKKCSVCRSKGVERKKQTLAVDVPAGITDGATLRLNGQGEAVLNGKTGDLYIHIRIKSDSTIERIDDSLDLETTLHVGMTDAALGATCDVRAVDGVVALDIPAGVQTGQRLRLKGKGVSSNRGAGDFYVQIVVDTPTKLSKNAKRLLEELRAEL